MAFKTVRRRDRQVGPEECRAILNKGEYGVLATAGPDGMPYATPLSYVFRDGRIYFHCAQAGHKIDNLAYDNRVSFVVVGDTEALFTNSGHFSTYYESVVVFGKAHKIDEDAEKYAALYDLVKKYVPERLDQAEEYIKKLLKSTAIYVIEIDSLTGKVNREKPDAV